jgi:hypothetical protein
MITSIVGLGAGHFNFLFSICDLQFFICDLYLSLRANAIRLTTNDRSQIITNRKSQIENIPGLHGCNLFLSGYGGRCGCLGGFFFSSSITT